MKEEFKGIELEKCNPTSKCLSSATNRKKGWKFVKEYRDWIIEQQQQILREMRPAIPSSSMTVASGLEKM
ncbi:hypothetical protein TNCT_575221 [Trichonephila clavata]|uniref:Uncharacterized protein n=1 Tax=Trichonephila clavata TaxID=2740835 RepID=A0A8X6F725_TRICU|nr:hypothetical protein TNCT_575221 [Trichonephila clavata]